MRIFYTNTAGLEPAAARRPGRTAKKGSAFAWSLLELAVGEVWGIDLPEVAEQPGGKPYFPGNPQLHFSLSHTGGAVLAALSEHPLGADVERRRVVSPVVERRLLEVEHGDLELFELWTLRESWYKLTGEGDLRDIPFSRVGGVIIPPDMTALCRVYDAIPGCAAAVCSLRDIPPENLEFIPPERICT